MATTEVRPEPLLAVDGALVAEVVPGDVVLGDVDEADVVVGAELVDESTGALTPPPGASALQAATVATTATARDQRSGPAR